MKNRLLLASVLCTLVCSTAAAGTQCTSQVPAMTSSPVRVGSVSSSGIFSSSYPAYQAFDQTNHTNWLSKTWQTPAWIAFQWSSGSRYVNQYQIRHSNGPSLTSRAPRDWSLQGSNNGGASWSTVDSQTAVTNWSSSQTRVFAVMNPGSYQHYRLLITDDNDIRPGNVVISIDQVVLLACPDHSVANGLDDLHD